MAWCKVQIKEFLTPRQERYKADDPAISDMPRIEKIDFTGKIFTSDKPSKTGMIVVQPGDFVISGINVAKGAMAVYQGDMPVKATIHYSSYEVDHNIINLEYFRRFLKSPVFLRLLKEQVPGGIKTEIKPKHLLPLTIDLPDIAEQESILSRFQNTENEHTELRSEIDNQKNLLSKLLQAILQEAIQGKLTADWREKHPDVEPTSELLKRIAAEKYKLIKKKKNRRYRGHSAIKKNDITFEIPCSWQWCQLDDLVDPTRGITYGIVKMGKAPPKGGIPALRCSDVKPRRIDVSGVRTVTQAINNQYARTQLRGREVLLNVRGTLGGCAVVPTQLVGYNIAREIALIPLSHDKMADYVVEVLASPFFIWQVDSNLKGIAYKGLNLNILRNLFIPLPPLEEQQVIIKRVQAKLAICSELEKEIAAAEQHAEYLSTAILQEVFDRQK